LTEPDDDGGGDGDEEDVRTDIVPRYDAPPILEALGRDLGAATLAAS
jgi:hypothetical protein